MRINLSSWGSKQQTIADWLVQEIWSKYQVPKAVGKDWIEKQQLLLLLDGLDEVKAECREACVQYINQFMQDHGQTDVVICSRIKDYEALSTRLQLRGAIFIHSLTPDQINQYLEGAGEQLKAVKILLREDTALQELARSPLTLSVMTLAYQGKTVEELSRTNSVEERRKHLFDTYIKRMFSQETIGKPREYKSPYQNQQAKLWLTWLSQRMLQESQTVFLIENIQPSWLRTNLEKWMYGLSISLSIILAIVIPTISMGLPVLFDTTIETTFGISSFLVFAFIAIYFGAWGLLLGVISSAFVLWDLMIGKPFPLCRRIRKFFGDLLLSNNLITNQIKHLWNFSTLFLSLIFKNYITSKVELVETVKWSWKGLLKVPVNGLRCGLIVGFVLSATVVIISGIVSLVFGVNSASLLDILISLTINLFFGVLIGTILGMFIGLLTGIWLMPYGGITIESKVDSTTIANEGIWKSLQNSITLGVVGIISGSIFGILVIFFPGTLASKLTAVMVSALLWCFGLGFLSAGAVTKHFILRLILFHKGYIPWNYASFLNYATERIFLQKVGGGYIFVHRMLQEHFAQMEFGE